MDIRSKPGPRDALCPEGGAERSPVIVNSCDSFDPGREKLEQYIAGIFQAAYSATVLEYLPLLFSLEQEGGIRAALGLGSARRENLFCEQYLSGSLEESVEKEFGRTVNRGQLMELGNLVSSSPGQAVALYLLVVAALDQAGISHLVFAANRAVRLSIRRCGFSTRDLGAADPAQLGEGARQWGSYYEGDPRVVLADIRQAAEDGAHHPAIGKLWRREQPIIASLADAIRCQRL